jgi:hypothetical protein
LGDAQGGKSEYTERKGPNSCRENCTVKEAVNKALFSCVRLGTGGT